MTLSPLEIGGIIFLFLLHWWLIWLMMRERSRYTVIPAGPFFVILLPTMPGILLGYHTAILSGHPTLDEGQRTAMQQCEDDHSGGLGAHYNIVVYDAREQTTYIRGQRT